MKSLPAFPFILMKRNLVICCLSKKLFLFGELDLESISIMQLLENSYFFISSHS